MKKAKTSEEQLDAYQSLEVLYATDGGKLLVATLLEDVATALERIAFQYKNLTYEEFVTLGAEISMKLSMARSLTRAEKNTELIKKSIEEDTE